MDSNPYAPDFSAMPDTIAIFPLTGVLLLPHGNLPLNIFEPRYVEMIDDAMASSKLIGMVQPKKSDANGTKTLYQTGCVGKITEFAETPDGRYIINLTGICRFHITNELDTPRPYRIVQPDWKEYDGDVKIPKNLGVDREKLMILLSEFFNQNGMSCDFDKFETIPDSRLITTLAMICPFEPSEKQALLEKICHKERFETFMTMLEMAINSNGPNNENGVKHH
ncbi:MAG: LON peptidase substrate-binding domain-containing protein [Bdellovibrionales bacterium]